MIESGFYTTERNELLVVFGGNIGVSSAVAESDEGMVCEISFRELANKHQIGEDLGPLTVEEYYKFSPVRLRFHDTKSIDVIIEELQELKKLCNDDE